MFLNKCEKFLEMILWKWRRVFYVNNNNIFLFEENLYFLYSIFY